MGKLTASLVLFIFIFPFTASAQQDASHDRDTFFLARKKGLLGRLGKSITRNNFPDEQPAKVSLPYENYKGKKIHAIEVMPLGFERSVNDTNHIKKNLGVKLANFFHKNTRENLIRRNLFFKEGDVFYPLLVSDNERFLRDLSYLQDALIVALESTEAPGQVDVIVLTKDVFSLGGSASLSSTNRIRGEISEDNFAGSGSRIALLGMYDRDRSPRGGAGFEYVKRGIRKGRGLFNWTTGLTTFNPAIVNGRREENKVYTTIDKLFITRYTKMTGALSLAYHMTSNAYIADSLYKATSRYSYLDADFWFGYNIGGRSRREMDSENRLRHFVALRSFYTDFGKIPDKYISDYNFNYANINGVLMQYNLYRQNFYKTKFIYGFGRNEDVPVGFHAGVTSGWTNKQGAKRWYYGMEFEGSTYSPRGFYSLYTFRLGGFQPKSSGLEDISLLLGVDHFTKLRWISNSWLNRIFVNVSYSRQFNPLLNSPLILQSNFGLPYVNNVVGPADERTTVKMESVFFNTNRYLGFRFAPFVFTDFSFLKPLGAPFSKTAGYSALGGGLRTRNENLVFGTLELRGYYFPRVQEGYSNWKVEFSTNIRFRYNTNFIRRPDFVIFN